MPTNTLTGKGQVTLPKKVRGEALELKGLLHRPGRKAVTLTAMDEAVARKGRVNAPSRGRG